MLALNDDHPDGGTGGLALEPQSVAAFYARLLEEMGKLDLHVNIYEKPNEVEDPIRFDRDEMHRSYDREYAHRFWRVLVQADPPNPGGARAAAAASSSRSTGSA